MFLAELLQLQRIYSMQSRKRVMVCSEFQGTGKEAAVAYLKVRPFLWNLAAATEEKQQSPH
jgi:hypothetical protein